MSKPALKSNVPALKTEHSALVAPPDDLLEELATDAGKGLSTAREDNLVPLIYLLQSNSPQVNKRDPSYLDGADPGDIWLRLAEHPIVKGNEGFDFQPCYFSIDWVEWIPRDKGGGFMGRHPDLPEEAKAVKDPQRPNRVKYVLPNGNELIQTRYHAGFVHFAGGQRLPYVLPFKSTGHTVSRQWMTMMNAKRLKDAKGNSLPAPSWACLYRLKTKQRTNVDGTFFVFEVTDAGWLNKEERERGKALYEAMASGEREVAHEDVMASTLEEAPF